MFHKLRHQLLGPSAVLRRHIPLNVADRFADLKHDELFQCVDIRWRVNNGCAPPGNDIAYTRKGYCCHMCKRVGDREKCDVQRTGTETKRSPVVRFIEKECPWPNCSPSATGRQAPAFPARTTESDRPEALDAATNRSDKDHSVAAATAPTSRCDRVRCKRAL